MILVLLPTMLVTTLTKKSLVRIRNRTNCHGDWLVAAASAVFKLSHDVAVPPWMPLRFAMVTPTVFVGIVNGVTLFVTRATRKPPDELDTYT